MAEPHRSQTFVGRENTLDYVPSDLRARKTVENFKLIIHVLKTTWR